MQDQYVVWQLTINDHQYMGDVDAGYFVRQYGVSVEWTPYLDNALRMLRVQADLLALQCHGQVLQIPE